MKKLELKNLKVKKVSKDEQASVEGGFLSIGRRCSERNNCARMHSRTWTTTDPCAYTN